MKKISNIIDLLKIVAKYGAYFIVLFDVVNYAVEKFEALGQKEDSKELQSNDK